MARVPTMATPLVKIVFSDDGTVEDVPAGGGVGMLIIVLLGVLGVVLLGVLEVKFCEAEAAAL